MSKNEGFKEVDVFSNVGVHIVNKMVRQKGYMLGILAAAIKKIEYDGEGEVRITLIDDIQKKHHEIMTDANKMALLAGGSE